MDEQAPATKPSDGSRGNLLLFAAAGIGIYILLKVLDPAIAFPLRYISSSVATFLLNALSIPATREGTVISTGEFTFDVNPDCSGSTSLRIMLTLGALWFGMYPNLTLGRRVVCLLFAAPIAVLCNALRVTTLVALGDRGGQPVEGLPHEVIGILAFALAMAMVYLMTLLMAKEPTVRERSGPRAHLLVLGGALLVCYAPVLWGVWSLAPTRLMGTMHLIFVAAGLGLLVFAAWGRRPAASIPGWVPVSLLVISLVLLVMGTFSDVISLSSLALALSLFAVLLYLRGPSGALVLLPLLGIIFVGLPTVLHNKVAAVAEAVVPGVSKFHLAVLVESLAVAALLGAFLWMSRSGPRKPPAESAVPAAGRLTAIPMKAMIFAAVLGLLFQTWFNSESASFDKELVLEIPQVLGDWNGVDRQVTPREIEVYGQTRILSRIYSREGSEPVHLLVSSTGRRRSSGHNPKNCMVALGWQVKEESVVIHRTSAGDMSMAKLLLTHGGEMLEMRYWFGDGESTTFLSFPEVYAADVGRRLLGRRTEWRAYRIYGRPGSESIDQFLDALVP